MMNDSILIKKLESAQEDDDDDQVDEENKFFFESNEYSWQLLKTLYVFQNSNSIYLSRPEIHDILINSNDYYSDCLENIMHGTDNFLTNNLVKFVDDKIDDTMFFTNTQISIIKTYRDLIDVSFD